MFESVIDAYCCQLFLFCMHGGVPVLSGERRMSARRRIKAGASMKGVSSFSKS